MKHEDEKKEHQSDAGRNDIDRGALIFGHPVFSTTPDGCLWTSPVIALYKLIKRRMLLRHSGFLQAPTGSGKTGALYLVMRQLLLDYPGLIIFAYLCQIHQSPSIRSFYKEFLSSLNHPELKGETWDLRHRVRRTLEEAGILSIYNFIVLWIDEAQAMSDLDFGFVRDLQTNLERKNIGLFILLSGEGPFLGTKLEVLARSQSGQAAADRFGNLLIPFGRYDDAAVASLFSAIDDAIWPASTSVTWPAFFFPRACADGFKLADQSNEFCNAMRRALGLSRDTPFQIRLTRYALSRYFLDNQKFDAPSLILPTTAWDRAIGDALGEVSSTDGRRRT